MSPRDGKRRVLSYEERVLWRAVTESIAPLNDGDGIVALTIENDSAETVPVKASMRVKATSLQPALPLPVKPPAAPPLAPLGRRMKQRVSRGREPIDARLDLHGLTQDQAHGALLRFLRHGVTRGARLVLVITGKGARSDRPNTHGHMHGEGERGVLKRQVPHWLGLPEFRSLVIGFETAAIGHGGEGALYIRLRRLRED